MPAVARRTQNGEPDPVQRRARSTLADTSSRPSRASILTQAILLESGAIALAGDKRATSAIKTQFPIWLGTPTAGPVGEGATEARDRRRVRPGGAEHQEVRLDRAVHRRDDRGRPGRRPERAGRLRRPERDQRRRRRARGRDRQGRRRSRASFDSTLAATTTTVEYDQAKPDGLQLAISAAMGMLEANGYGDQSQMGVLLGFGFNADHPRRPHARSTRRCRSTARTAAATRCTAWPVEVSTNLTNVATAPGATDVLGFVVHRPEPARPASART